MTTSLRGYTPSPDRWSYFWLLIGAGLLLFANGRSLPQARRALALRNS